MDDFILDFQFHIFMFSTKNKKLTEDQKVKSIPVSRGYSYADASRTLLLFALQILSHTKFFLINLFSLNLNYFLKILLLLLLYLVFTEEIYIPRRSFHYINLSFNLRFSRKKKKEKIEQNRFFERYLSLEHKKACSSYTFMRDYPVNFQSSRGESHPLLTSFVSKLARNQPRPSNKNVG